MAQKILIASDGNVYTNGRIGGKVVYLPQNADVSDFREVTEEEYNATEKEGD